MLMHVEYVIEIMLTQTMMDFAIEAMQMVMGNAIEILTLHVMVKILAYGMILFLMIIIVVTAMEL